MENIPLWWSPPFLNGPDHVIDAATREYITLHPTYSLGDLIDYLRHRIPQLRIETAKARAEAARRAHADRVNKIICDQKVAA